MSVIEIIETTSVLSPRDRREHLMVRLGHKRMEHKVTPGLYRLGEPGRQSPVFVTANYKLSFDALRVGLDGRPCYILVLDTKGINVWCAAGKGTFGAEQIKEQVDRTGLRDLVDHRCLVLPQLSASGVCAHEVRRSTGFNVEFGPVRAEDLSCYLESGDTPEMRRVRFGLKDRAVLIPVELKNYLPYALLAMVVAFLLLGSAGAVAVVVAYITGTVLFPLLLPLLPSRSFSLRGFLLGAAVSLAFALSLPWWGDGVVGSSIGLETLAWVLLLSPWVAYIALNFTGSTTFTSRTGVRRDIYQFIPVMAVAFIGGVVLMIILHIYHWGWS